MIDFILTLIIASLWIWGVFAAFDDGNIFSGIRKVAERLFGTELMRPVFGCPYCMASIHGGLIGFYWYGFSLVVIPFVICLCGLNYVVTNLIWE